ncbi:insulin-like growth factor-binding protein complex acid labile subunit [Xenia sp. Carnegie-2017]|uniref:insulin-like growth factor-binding protein complex acid labile subunit n=1 Tax=Xenia sp. Carnegie-2017 TaxID=2897299 RepID=UPI001F0357FD|nr:insulin-like growth factor-binding protein complex acid labile subunit [Xenia sp. Carnegie-2017]
MFNGLIELENLDLSHNNIAEIPKGCFKTLNKLRNLNISHNKIKKIDRHTFDGLCSLEMLSFEGNETYVKLRDIFTLRDLKIVEMSCKNCCPFLCLNNSITCNCSGDPRKECPRRLLHKESYRVFVWITVVLILLAIFLL